MILVKILKAKHKKSFMSGKLYMNNLSFFWKHGNEEQCDSFEGISGNLPIEKVKSLFDQEPALRDNIKSFAVQPEAAGFCNVLSMSKIDVKRIGEHFEITAPADMRDFGDKAVIILDNQEFFRRVSAAVEAKGFSYCCGDVNYSAPLHGKMRWKSMQAISLAEFEDIRPEKSRDAFEKPLRYEKQNEWRIAIWRNTTEETAYTLDIGDLHDIVRAVDTRKLLDKSFVESLIKEENMDHIGYFGNCTREQLRARMLETTGGRYYFFMGI